MSKIQLCDQYNCTQCMACVNACPKGCIAMIDAGEGFYIPQISRETCVECGSCMRVCHRIDPKMGYNQPMKTLACWTKNDSDRKKSSSGGAFSVLARKTLNKGGVVYGATMDRDLKVKHICVDNTDNIRLLQGSKYVQSFLGETYKSVQEQLKGGREVLFTGTPCQVGGLLTFLRKKYDNLITCDMVCHGVPSQRSFNAFCERTHISGTCDSVSFRFTEGCGFQLARELVSPTKDGDSNSTSVRRKPILPPNAWYMRAFNKSLMFNESCYTCPYATPQRISDFTMADYWGLGSHAPFNHPTFKGVSMLLVNNERAWAMIQDCPDLFYEERTLEEAIEGNYNLSHCSSRPAGRDSFIKDMENMPENELLAKYGIKANLRDYLRLLKQWINSNRV